MSAGNSQAPSVIKSCRDGGTEPSPLLAAGAGAKNIDPACAGPRVLLILVDLSRAPLCVDPQFWRFQRSNIIKYVSNSLLVFSCCAVTLGCSGSVQFFVFLYGLPLLSGFPADASRRRFRIWSAQGWLDSGRLAEPEVLGLLPAHLSCLSLGFPTFSTLPPKAFVLSSALGISLF